MHITKNVKSRPKNSDGQACTATEWTEMCSCVEIW